MNRILELGQRAASETVHYQPVMKTPTHSPWLKLLELFDVVTRGGICGRKCMASAKHQLWERPTGKSH